MLRHRIGFWSLALGAAVLAACSAGGGGGSLVPQGFEAGQAAAFQAFAGDARHRRHPVRARVYLRIPAPRQHRHRGKRMHPDYVSPGTASISFAVTPIAASSSSLSPTPMPLQTMNVATPSPCATYPSSNGALMCTFTVNVMPGSDSFVVTTYTGANATGKALSEYSSGPTIIPTPNAKGGVVPLGFTLEGVIDHVVLQYPSSVVPADTQGQVGAIPVGVATTIPLNVTPFDAANYQILSQVPATGTPVPYSAPVTLGLTPNGKGFMLSNASGSGNTVTISGPSDLAVNVVYDGSFTASGGSVSSATSFSIAATGTTLAAHPHKKIDVHAPRAATPAPNAAGIALSGNSIPGGTYSTTLTSASPGGLVIDPSTGTMSFLGSGLNASLASTAILGTATNGVPSTAGEISGSTFSGMHPDSQGNLWTFDSNLYQIDCFSPSSLATPAGTIPAATIFSGQLSSYIAGFTEDSSNNLWFVVYGFLSAGGGFETIGYVPINSTSCASPAPVIYQASSASYPSASSVAAIPGTASVAIAAYDPTAGNVIQVAATSPPTTPPAPTVATVPAAGQPQALFGGATTYGFMSGALGSVSPAGAFSTITSYPADLATFVTTTTSAAQSASGVLGATLYDGSFGPYDFVTLMNPADANASTNLEILAPAPYCNGIAFDAQDTAWTFCTNPQGNLQFYHIVPTSTWSLIPGTTVTAGVSGCVSPFTGGSYIGVLEAFGATAGPFTMTNYNSSVISGITPEGSRGLSFTITEPATGSYVETADVADKSGRTVAITIDITASSSGCSPRRPGQRPGARQDPHARRGYPPVSRN